MLNKLIAASAFSLMLATGAVAQTSTGDTTGSTTGGDTTGSSQFTSPVEAEMMQNWPEEIRMGFFTDDTMTTLRSEDEINTAYGALTPEQQQAIKDDCTNVTGDTTNSYGRSVVDLCTLVGAGTSIQ